MENQTNRIVICPWCLGNHRMPKCPQYQLAIGFQKILIEKYKEYFIDYTSKKNRKDQTEGLQ